MIRVAQHELRAHDPLNDFARQELSKRLRKFFLVDFLIDHVRKHQIGPLIDIGGRQISRNIQLVLVRLQAFESRLERNDDGFFLTVAGNLRLSVRLVAALQKYRHDHT